MFDDFYGLTGRPFQLTPDPKFYFESGSHRKALSYLGYGLAQGEGFIVITGEVGAGKSTLVAHLVDTIDANRLTIGQVVTSKLDGEEIIHVVANAFGLDIEGHDKAGALAAIESYLHEEAREGRRVLLVVDESQNLSIDAIEELRMLSNFQLGAHSLLQVLLLGQPEFRETLSTSNQLEQLRQRVIATHHLDAMEPGEVQPYIQHRLKVVGWQGNPSIDQRVYSELYEATGGVPRRVNQVANRLMLLGAVEQRSRIDSAMLKAVLAEMASDQAFPAAAPSPMPKVGPNPAPLQKSEQNGTASAQDDAESAHESAPAAAAPQAALDPQLVEDLLAERDVQIAELQQAVIELAEASEAASEAESGLPSDLAERIERIESQLDEQQRTLRHTLTMLIEWIESETPRAAA